MKIYPWQQQQWRQLKARQDEGHLPHALLFIGLAGLGKRQFARALAQALLCRYRDSEGFACGACPDCKRFQAGTHPDFLSVAPEEEGSAITVDSVRAVGGFLTLKSHYEGNKIVVLDPADGLNTAAANGLLKTLEEPAPGALLILLSCAPGRLLPTVRSRCQQVKFAAPPSEAARGWLRSRLAGPQDEKLLLNLTAGAPLQAVKLAEAGLLEQRMEMLAQFSEVFAGRRDPVAVAQQWVRQNQIHPAVFWVNSWVMDIIRLKFASDPPSLVNSDAVKQLRMLARGVDKLPLSAYQKRTASALHQLQASLNGQLLLEELLIGWAALARQRGSR